MGKRITVLGIGNRYMGDDGVGPSVVGRLREGPGRPDVSFVVGDMAGMGLLAHFRASNAVIVVDALDAGAEPGAIFRFDPDEAGVTSLRSNNIHGMGVSYLLTNARLSGCYPEVVVYAVQVADVRPSESLSPEVGEAADRVAELVLGELERMSA